ncbi:ABC transporter ATP-binding protein [Treponema sp.]|uniref:ABC transporter ATP-binding protein n=1 Tax=Treponema sp. TaxID=166 RepID=UPI00388FBBA8
MIELRNFSKSYSSKNSFAVKDCSMICQKGKITGLLGLNGAGKTTILKAVCARHFATGGEVLIEGIEAGVNAEKVRNLTGFVEEEPNLPGEYTVEEYLHMVQELHGVKSSVDASDNIKDVISVRDILSKKIKTLSKGQKQRVNFAQALIYNPKVLVLDEPASGLDPAQIINMRNLVKSLKDTHTILLSTHLMQEVEALCDTVYIIKDGNIAASGTSEEIASQFQSRTLEEAFFKITGAADIAGEQK